MMREHLVPHTKCIEFTEPRPIKCLGGIAHDQKAPQGDPIRLCLPKGCFKFLSIVEEIRAQGPSVILFMA